MIFSIVGAALIVIGLYAIIWAKEKEVKEQNLLKNHYVPEQDIEIKQENK